MSKLALVVLNLLAIFTLVACGSGDLPSEPTAPVKGAVTLDGKPMESGNVVFSSMTGKGIVTLEVKNGAYSGQVIVGENGVSISSGEVGEGQTNGVAAKFNTASTLTAKVEKNGANEFNFEVTSQ